MKKQLYLLVLFLCLLSSCSHLSLYQDAKTIGKGNFTAGGTLLLQGKSDSEEVVDDIYPDPSIFTAYGLTNNFDIQFKLGLVNLALIPKFQILGNQDSKFALALNPAIGIGHDLRFDGDGSTTQVNYSTILSYHPTKVFSIFVEPQYITAYMETNEFLRGGNFGIFIRTDSPIDLSFGGSLFQEQLSGKFIYQFGVGFRCMRPFRKQP